MIPKVFHTSPVELSAKLVVLPLKICRLWAASHSLHCCTVAHATTISCLDFYNDFLNDLPIFGFALQSILNSAARVTLVNVKVYQDFSILVQ